jgi:heat shock protein HslJ
MSNRTGLFSYARANWRWALCGPLICMLAMPLAIAAAQSSVPTGSDMSPPPGVAIVNVEWHWTDSTDATGQSISIDDPTLYTLMLQPDGSYEVHADCNLSAGTFFQEDTAITFNGGPTTLAECAPGSLSSMYLSNIGSVTGFNLNDDGTLLLMLGDSAGQMLFVPANNVGAFTAQLQ